MTDVSSGLGQALQFDTVTLLSDYGNADGNIGVIHSIIRQLAPGVGIVDLSHDIAPFDVRGASLLLARSVQYLCPGVIVALVDPGAGPTRRSIAVEVADGAAVIMGPDNGVIAPAVGMLGGAQRAIVLDRPEFLLETGSTTSSGRDVFAPAAANLCAGARFDELGSLVDATTLMPGVVPLSTTEDGVVSGEVLWVDHFGNVQLNVDPSEIAQWDSMMSVSIAEVRRTVRRVSGFGELATGELGLLVDGHGLVSLVANESSAAVDLDLAVGDGVSVSEPNDSESTNTGVTTPVQLGRTLS